MIETRWLYLVLMLPNLKCHKEDKVYFDEGDDEGVLMNDVATNPESFTSIYRS